MAATNATPEDVPISVPIADGELRVCSQRILEFDELGLIDPGAWREGRLRGRVVHRRRERSVVQLESESGPLFAKHQRGKRTGEWLRELVRVRRPLSSAGREARAARALRSIGIDAPRILLEGETRSLAGIELESFLVSEELAGTSLEELPLDAELARGLGRLALDLARARVSVPDLYAKHVHVSRDGGELRFGLLDLPRVEPHARRTPRELFVRHAGGLVATVPGLEPARLVADSPWSAEPGLERRIEARAALVRRRKKLPGSYAARERYATEAEVEDYRQRSEVRNAAELELLERALPTKIAGRVLDAPCGAGRFSAFLRERGAEVLAVDLSPAMVRAARPHADHAAVAELERLPLADDALLGSLCFRFLHHVPSAPQRRRVLGELTRVSRAFVVLSVFHPVSAHNVLRNARRLLTRRPPSRHCVTIATLSKELEDCGWRVDACLPQARYLRDLWVVRAVPR